MSEKSSYEALQKISERSDTENEQLLAEIRQTTAVLGGKITNLEKYTRMMAEYGASQEQIDKLNERVEKLKQADALIRDALSGL